MWAKSELWLIVLFAVFDTLTVVLYLGTYAYCLIKDKDALRSETYSIQRLALEKGVLGDSTSGILRSTQIDIPVVKVERDPEEGV